ncbi:MAG TPA: peptide ABC transporter substrate-binding protein [Thermoflexales bacterium]|nr:peptide ABC transporter substrate-binding protein [Thermoflexales bacterium]HQW35426.1 peptide ABC transporter substrate-binding protein [Thermoflexales bacterium]HQZ22321.1 peptide ABC transporter substrate-binding protein [Thermoflexales bacterium]HRA00611.1 peptide ABC transporter substrate-binding protein [Thermoflexales bacterium]
MSRKQIQIAGGLLAAASMVLTACGAAPTAVPAAVQTTIVEKVVTAAPVIQTVVVAAPTATAVPKAKVVRVNLGTYPDNLDPQKASFVNEIAHLKLVYEGLTKFDKDLNTVPGAAEKWAYNADGTELTFTLRKGAKYADGSPLNAKRFEYSIIRNINPETAGEYAFVTNDYIAGANAWNDAVAAVKDAKDDAAKKTATEAATKAEATLRANVIALDGAGAACKDYKQEDCLTLKIKLGQPTPFFHTIMALWVAYPAKEENITAGKEQWTSSSKFQVGNGPYAWKTLEPQVKSRFEPNANYWGDKAKTAIEFSYITDSAIAFNAYKNNEFDVIALGAEDLKTVKADADLSKQALIYAGSCTTGLQMNEKFPPFEDKNFRAAVSMAFDRKSYADNILAGLATPTLTWIPPGYPGYDKAETRNGYNLDESKKALAASKYATADKVPGGKLIYLASNSPRNKTRGEYIVQMLSKNLGIPVEMQLVEPTEYTARQKKGDLPGMFLGGWCADFPHQTNWLPTYFNSKSFASRFNYSNKDNDKLMSDADVTVDTAKAAGMYDQAQKTIVGDVPMAFLYNSANAYLVKPWVKGVIQTPQDSGWAGDTVPTSIDVDTAMLPK